jgi:hypothetical protein
VTLGILLALIYYMKMPDKILKCYIASFMNKQFDAVLEYHNVSRGIISFSIPGFGVMFRARAEGTPLDMEIGVFFSLLEFIKSKVNDQNIKNIEVYSSNSQFVFSFKSDSMIFKPDSPRKILLKSYTSIFQVNVSYIDSFRNLALTSPTDNPSLPIGKSIDLDFTEEELNGLEFKDFQTGLKL